MPQLSKPQSNFHFGAVLGASCLFILWWFRVYLTDQNIAAVDLPSHIALTRSLKEQLLNGRITFYDFTTFTGFPAFRFYGFLPALCTAILAFVFELFGYDGVTLATHVILLLGMALFPLSFYFAVKPFALELVGGEENLQRRSFGFASILAAFSFWFLNHDKQWFGIGAAAPMNIGLFAQVFGWHLLLLYIGCLARLRLAATRLHFVLLAIVYALLPLCHTLTFVYASYLAALAFLFFSDLRRKLIAAHLLGFGLAAFWFIPALALLGSYSTYDVSRPTGDFLEIFFRYPWYGLWRSFLQGWADGRGRWLDIIHILLPFLLLVLLGHRAVKRDGLIFSFFIFALLGVLFFSSGFVATSLPLGLHYYRFFAYHFLVLMVVFAAVPLALGAAVTRRWIVELPICLVCCLAFIATAQLPHDERSMIARHVGTDYLQVEKQVLEYFRQLPNKGRVYIEYLKDYKRFPQLSAHYLSSRMHPDTGFESIVNSHLQESMSYRMIAGTANLLEAHTYHVPLLFAERADLDTEDLIAQLRGFGITHFICGRKKSCNALEDALGQKPLRIGKYRIFELLASPLPKIEPANKHLVGYVDERGNLPFYLLQYYFYARSSLFREVDLIALEKIEDAPPGLSMLLVNNNGASPNLSHPPKQTEIFSISYERPEYFLDHYSPHYPHNIEFDKYREIESDFDKRKFPEMLLGALTNKKQQSQHLSTQPQLIWSSAGQKMQLTNLEPNNWYRINYSYFPYWQSSGGQFFRGSGERIFAFSEKADVVANYSAWSAASTWIGLLLSLFSLAIVGIILVAGDSRARQ